MKSLYYKGGHKVFDVKSDSLCVKDVNIEDMDDAFYIHHKNQINYTFMIVV